MSRHRVTDRRVTDRRVTERGTALLLYPAGVMVLMVLASISVDLSAIRLARQELDSTVQVAADDAAGMVDESSLRSGDRLVIDLDRARRLVEGEMALADTACVSIPTVTVDLGPRPGTVTVTARCEVAHIFGRALPGVPRTEPIVASAVGERVQL